MFSQDALAPNQTEKHKSYLWYSFIVILIGLLSGCSSVSGSAGHWVNANKSQSAIKAEHEDCIQQVWNSYPMKKGMVSAENGHWELAHPGSSECKYLKMAHETVCTHTPPSSEIWVGSDMIEGDENAKYRLLAYSKCMTSTDNDYQCINNGQVVSGTLCGKY